MANDVTIQGNTQLAIPADIAAMFAGKSNLIQSDNTPSIGFRGKVWQINVEGMHKQLLDADDNPRPMIEVIVLGANQRRSRSFYSGTFTEGSNKAPDCHSYDGKYPASDVTDPPASNCETCPNSVKGSKVNDNGKETTACALRQRIVVVPSNKPEYTALLINMPSTSAYDKNEAAEAKGWFSWTGYTKMLNARGVPHTAAVKTSIRFEPSDAYPRLQFKYSGAIDSEVAPVILSRIDTDEVKVLLDKEFADKSESKPVQKVVQAPAKEPEVDIPSFDAPEKVQPVKEVKAKKVVEKAKEPEKKPDPVIVEDGDDGVLAAALASWD